MDTDGHGLNRRKRTQSPQRLEPLIAPVFFRTSSGQKPSREDLEKLLDLIGSAD
jgi:hypothetical protein